MNLPRLGSAAIALLFAAIGVARGQGYAPAAAAKALRPAAGLHAQLFAHEPDIRQPIFVKFDDRGRLWTIQYLQYPNPAGLKRVRVDRWSRTVYDRVPKPPPHGPRGADRITIVEDRSGDGRADTFTDFVSGLNLCTGVEFGYGGVFVLQVPYLLFYPDADGDDRPDSDPHVLLSGFGMEDAQSFANHLTWGPDGWLYGVNGSTTTCRIRGIEFQQGCWRYHPRSREFELFCEGGGNTYGLTFDEDGNLFYSTNGGPFVHAVQGGYYYKSFGKHGPLHNLFAYHHFAPLQRDQVPGGPPTGGTIYAADALGKSYRGKFIAGNFLGHTVSSWRIEPRGATVAASYERPLLDVGDTWSGPTDLCIAPDGSIFVCDFYDRRTAHPDPDARWDRGNGRIYRISSAELPAELSAARSSPAALDLRKQSSDQLVDLLTHNNRWFATRARVLLAERRDASVAPRLKALAANRDRPRDALQGVWTLHACGELDDPFAMECLSHPYPYVRSWTVRLLGDRKQVSSEVSAALVRLARKEPSAIVRAQLAATAKRLPAETGLAIVTELLDRGIDDADERIAWLLWWAIESKSVSDREEVLAEFGDKALWSRASYRGNLRRLIRRYAAEGTAAGYDACAKLLSLAPANQQGSALAALQLGLDERASGLATIGQGGLFADFAAATGDATPQQRQFKRVSGSLRRFIYGKWKPQPTNAPAWRLALTCGVEEARDLLLQRLADERLPSEAEKQTTLRLAAGFIAKDEAPLLLRFLSPNENATTQLAALDALSRFPSESLSDAVLENYPRFSPPVQTSARRALLSNSASARRLLELVDAGAIKPDTIPVAQLRVLAAFGDPRIDKLVKKHWGRIGSGSTEAKLAAMRRYNNDLRAGGGSAARGKELFKKNCGACHQLFGEGGKIGPDLTQANRKDRAALLANLVDPGAVVKRQYINYILETTGGRVLTGLIAAQDAASVTIVDAEDRRTRVSRGDIATLRESPVSLMPDNALDKLQPQQIRDLFAYLTK
ncbi:MAG: c-type cytochrome [Pirellulaceae bacterium]|nr:c-type cytochrome [Pirellulaceae bacterium]